MHRAVYPGSFDPVTNGHVDIVTRAAKLFDHLTIAIGINHTKGSMFSVEERTEMLQEATKDCSNVDITAFSGLLVDFCQEWGIGAIVKGLRAVSDFDYELQMAQMNVGLTGVETVFMPTSAEYSYLSSSLVKEVASYGGDVTKFVPAQVWGRLRERVVPVEGTGRQPPGDPAA